MPKFVMMVEGRGFPARAFAGASGPLGFSATRFIEAGNADDAETMAIQMLRDEFRPIFGARLPGEAMPTLHLVEICEVKEFPAEAGNGGATWFEATN